MTPIIRDTQYRITRSSNYTILELMGYLTFENIKDFEIEINKNFYSPHKHLIINGYSLNGMSKQWIRLLLLVISELKKLNKETRFILLSNHMKEFFRSEGLDKAFKVSSNLRSALVELKLVKKNELNTEFINPFLDATIHVLKIQSKLECCPGKIYLKEIKENFLDHISGIIGIISDSFNGSIIISFPKKTFLNIMSKMLEEDFKDLNNEIIDGAGEITNMIFGNARFTLNQQGYGIKTALPSVVYGQNEFITSLSVSSIVVVPFTSDAGNFYIEICIAEEKG